MICRGFGNRRSHEFEHTRAIVYAISSVYRTSENKLPPIEQFWPLPTDDLEAMKEKEEREGERLYEKLQAFKKKYAK